MDLDKKKNVIYIYFYSKLFFIQPYNTRKTCTTTADLHLKSLCHIIVPKLYREVVEVVTRHMILLMFGDSQGVN